MERFKWTPEPRPKFLVNGQVTGTADLPHAIQNRAFLYGDGFFESVRICYGKPQLIPFHWNRIQSSLRAHKMDASGWNLFHFELALHELCDANGIDEGGRIRLTFFRDGGGRYTPNTDKLCWIGEAEKLPHCEFVLNEQGLAVDVFPEMKKLQDPLANFKNISASIYVQAGLWAKEQALEDALLKNTGNHIIESTRSNLFLVSNGVLYTPGLDGGPVGGVMRAAIINLALKEGYKVYECNISPQEMLRADEMFLTNAIRGIQWVARYRSKRYFNATSKELIGLLNAGITR